MGSCLIWRGGSPTSAWIKNWQALKAQLLASLHKKDHSVSKQTCQKHCEIADIIIFVFVRNIRQLLAEPVFEKIWT